MAVTNCRSRWGGRDFRMEREALVISKPHTLDSLYDPVSRARGLFYCTVANASRTHLQNFLYDNRTHPSPRGKLCNTGYDNQPARRSL